jgi:integrase
VAYAFFDREGMRKGEMQRLTRADVNLKNGLVSLEENKTDRPRSWVPNASVAAMLKRWFEISPGKPTDPVFPGIAWEKLARVFREHCEAVGIDRRVSSGRGPSRASGASRKGTLLGHPVTPESGANLDGRGPPRRTESRHEGRSRELIIATPAP